MNLYEEFLDGWVPNYSTHPCPQEAALEVVVIEAHKSATLPLLLANVSCVLPNAALTVVHSSANSDQIGDALGPCHTATLLPILSSDEPQYIPDPIDFCTAPQQSC